MQQSAVSYRGSVVSFVGNIHVRIYGYGSAQISSESKDFELVIDMNSYDPRVNVHREITVKYTDYKNGYGILEMIIDLIAGSTNAKVS